jgi:hypothetical protein
LSGIPGFYDGQLVPNYNYPNYSKVSALKISDGNTSQSYLNLQLTVFCQCTFGNIKYFDDDDEVCYWVSTCDCDGSGGL